MIRDFVLLIFWSIPTFIFLTCSLSLMVDLLGDSEKLVNWIQSEGSLGGKLAGPLVALGMMNFFLVAQRLWMKFTDWVVRKWDNLETGERGE